MNSTKQSPFASAVAVVSLGILGSGLQFNGIPASIYRQSMREQGLRYDGRAAWVRKDKQPMTEQEATAIAAPIAKAMADYAKAQKAAAKAANLETAAPAKAATRGRKSAAHLNLEQKLGATLTKEQFAKLQAIIA